MKTAVERAMLASIKLSAFHWGTYKKWTVGNIHNRQFYMKIGMKDIVLACAMYRVEARKRRIYQ